MIAAHPAAKLFPLLEGDELQALADDIHDRGLLHPGVVFDGLLLDGRNRQSACEIAGVAFATERLRSCESPTAYVLSANLKRRHLSATQRAVLGAESVEHFEREAKERQRVGGRAAGRGRPIASLQTARKLSKALGESTTRAAKAAGAGTRNTAVMVAIRKKAPDVFAAVKAGSLPKVAEARAIAALPSDQRADVLARVERGVSPKTAVRAVCTEATAKAVVKAKRQSDRFRVIVGDMNVVLPTMPAHSVDIIITDPPYSRESLPVYEQLSLRAAHVLRPGGSCLVLVGQSYLPDVLAALGKHLTYHWIVAYLTPGGQAAQIWRRRVNTFWKPLLWFVRGAYEGPWVGDVTKSAPNDNDKRFHGWGQSETGMADIVERFTRPGETILDPFCGAGTTGVAALARGRRFIGVELDEQHANVAISRLAEAG